MDKETKKKQLAILKERRGEVPELLKEKVKSDKKIKTLIIKAFDWIDTDSNKKRTIPEIAQETGLDTADITWHLASMRKYGSAMETTDKSGQYFKWALVKTN